MYNNSQTHPDTLQTSQTHTTLSDNMTVHYIYNSEGTVTAKEIPDDDAPNAAADELEAMSWSWSSFWPKSISVLLMTTSNQ
jgi:hypothetical protein